MLKKHSHSIGVICGGLNMLPWVIFGIYTLCFPESAVPYETAAIACFFSLSLAGLLGSLFLRKKPMLGVTLMLISGMLSFAAAELYWWAGIPPILLIAAGILAYISAKTSPGRALQNEDPDRAVKTEKRRYVVKSLSRILGVAGSALPAFLYLTVKYFFPGAEGEEANNDFYLIENVIAMLTFTAGLTGSLFAYKKPLLAGVLMVFSGLLAVPICVSALQVLEFYCYWLSLIPAAILLGAGVLAFAGYNNTSVSPPRYESSEQASSHEKRRPIIKRLSRILGMAGSALPLLAFLYYVFRYLTLISFPDAEAAFGEEAYTDFYLIVNIIAMLTFTAGLAGSLFAYQKPLLAGALMLLSGLFGIYFCLAALPIYPFNWVALIPTALLIAAGALALAGYNNAPVSPPQNEFREPAGQ